MKMKKEDLTKYEIGFIHVDSPILDEIDYNVENLTFEMLEKARMWDISLYETIDDFITAFNADSISDMGIVFNPKKMSCNK